MQAEFDDTMLAEPHRIEVLWNATDDDFQPKPSALLARGVDFAVEALDREGTMVFVHCAAGVHRAPMMTLAILCSLGWNIEDAMQLIEARRPVVDFAEVYVQSVESFLQSSERGKVGSQR
jgi:protein-tyrosine phosphatase